MTGSICLPMNLSRSASPERPVYGNLGGDADRLELAGCRSSADSIERPLKKIRQSSRREGPRWIGEQPFSEANRSTVDDPLRTLGLLLSGYLTQRVSGS